MIFFYHRTPFFEQGILTHQKSSLAKAPAFPLAGFKVLDVGCGAGILCESLGRLGAQVTGIDPSEDIIEAAHQHAKEVNLTNVFYEAKTIENFQPFNATLFDAVIASEVIEHVDNPELFIEKCSGLLKVYFIFSMLVFLIINNYVSSQEVHFLSQPKTGLHYLGR
jgi:polyprenyldihydroxybenzoate methyltransferase/3-demethylubiquinol 3-O-methyltransferase